MNAQNGISRGSIIAILFFLYLATTTGVSAISYGGIGGVPATPQPGEQKSTSIFIHTVSPGSVIEEGLIVTNTTNTQKRVFVAAADGITTNTGALSCDHWKALPQGVGAWIAVQKEPVVVPAFGTKLVPLTIRIPEGVAVGEHNGCVILEDADAPIQQGNAFSIRGRIGIRVALTVPGGMVEHLTQPTLTLISWDDRQYTAQVSVRNNGFVSIDTDATLQVRSFPFAPLKKEWGGRFPVFRESQKAWHGTFETSRWGGVYIIRALLTYEMPMTSDSSTERRQVVLEIPTTYLFVAPTRETLLIELLVAVILLLTLLLFSVRWRRVRVRKRLLLVRKKLRQAMRARYRRRPWRGAKK